METVEKAEKYIHYDNSRLKTTVLKFTSMKYYT